jgi:hypothetical protein
MPADNIFTFYLMSDGTNNYFSLPDDNTIDINHHTVKIYSFNSDTGNYSYLLTELDLYHAYLHWDLSSIANGYVCKMMGDNDTNYIKEYSLDLMKVSGIVSSKTSVHIWFASDGERGFHVWFRILVLE